MFTHGGKTGEYEGEKKRLKKNQETPTTSPAIVLEEKAIMQETENDPHKRI